MGAAPAQELSRRQGRAAWSKRRLENQHVHDLSISNELFGLVLCVGGMGHAGSCMAGSTA